MNIFELVTQSLMSFCLSRFHNWISLLENSKPRQLGAFFVKLCKKMRIQKSIDLLVAFVIIQSITSLMKQ